MKKALSSNTKNNIKNKFPFYIAYTILSVFSLAIIIHMIIDTINSLPMLEGFKHDIFDILPLLYKCKLGQIVKNINVSEETNIPLLVFSTIYAFLDTLHYLGIIYLVIIIAIIIIYITNEALYYQMKISKIKKILIWLGPLYLFKFILCGAIFGLCYNQSSSSISIGVTVMECFQILLNLAYIAFISLILVNFIRNLGEKEQISIANN